ncbi:uncharacterized protein LOC116773854 isoform X2 [Danaus plexippus]|uniref:uncharacterized protein LOC116773854 isoform X2 n=1 Tax=Danaus plexippus TaxID=13037 RepID=UPI002AB21682|nr:uncharacterized protein LOC116773854 isoform X2 [Danaus plexippus]
MAANGYGTAPMAGHIGRIPNFGKTQPMGSVEPPACIQNAMMTKDKKPFTYTPGGLDLSQIRTPSMARRMARQRSLEEQEHAYPNQANNNPQPQGVPAPPPPPPQKIPAPPPPPPLIIEAPKNSIAKPIPAVGDRPEIVIPENPIGMLRKTNSPYHWEAEKAELQRIGPVPKFVEKVPSPLTVKLPAHYAPQNYSSPNNVQRPNFYGNQNHSPESPLHRPEAQYAHQKSGSPNISGSPQTREMLVRQDSQFNKSPQPFANQSPCGNSPFSPTPNNHWRQPERRDSPASVTNSPQSPHINRGPFSGVATQSPPNYNQTPNNSVFHTLPRGGQRNQDVSNNNVQNDFNTNIKEKPLNETAPWRTQTLNRHPRENQQSVYNNNTQQQPSYNPPWKVNETTNNNVENKFGSPWKQDSRNSGNVGESQQISSNQHYTPPWVNQEYNRGQESSPWRTQEKSVPPVTPPETRYQSSISIPVTPRKQTTQSENNSSPHQKEAVYVNQEPVYYCPGSPKVVPGFVKTQKEKTKTPPPSWCQRPLDGTKIIPRELATPPRENNQEPEWIKKSNDMQRGNRDVVSPPRYQQPVQPNWSTRPSENRKSLPRETSQASQGSRIIPIQMEVSSTETRNQGKIGSNPNQPQLRIFIDMKQNPDQNNAQAPYSQPTQRIMRVLSPQLVRMDENQSQPELPTLNRSFHTQDSQPKTRIIPIQIEGGSGAGANKSVYHKIRQDTSPRQSKAFKVLQVITGTDGNLIQFKESDQVYSDL